MAVAEWFLWLRSQPYVLEAVLVLLAVLLLPYLVRWLWQQWRIYSVLRTVPYDPDVRFLTGHIHKV